MRWSQLIPAGYLFSSLSFLVSFLLVFALSVSSSDCDGHQHAASKATGAVMHFTCECLQLHQEWLGSWCCCCRRWCCCFFFLPPLPLPLAGREAAVSTTTTDTWVKFKGQARLSEPVELANCPEVSVFVKWDCFLRAVWQSRAEAKRIHEEEEPQAMKKAIEWKKKERKRKKKRRLGASLTGNQRDLK